LSNIVADVAEGDCPAPGTHHEHLRRERVVDGAQHELGLHRVHRGRIGGEQPAIDLARAAVQAARAASNAAPTMPRLPPMIARVPKCPCARCVRAAPAIRARRRRRAGPGDSGDLSPVPRSSTSTRRMFDAVAGEQARLVRENVSVWVARTADPRTRPVSASRPLGTSIASTGPRRRSSSR
jgi:hypothetical protein